MSGAVDVSDPVVETEESSSMLHGLFLKVDELRTGRVRATALVSKMSELVPDADKWKMQELSKLLDHNSDDIFVTEDNFIDIGLVWIGGIVSEDDSRRRNRESVASSLQILDFSAMNATFASFNGTGTFGEFDESSNIEQKGNEAEFNSLKKRLSEEKFSLENQLYSAEEAANQMQSENEQLKGQVRELGRHLAAANAELSEQKIVQQGEEEDDDDPDGDPKEGRCLGLAQELARARCREKEALDMADDLKVKISQLEEEAKVKSSSKNKRVVEEEEARVVELTMIKAKLQEDIKRIQVEASGLLDLQQSPLVGGGEGSFGTATTANHVGGGMLDADVSFDSMTLSPISSPGIYDPRLPSSQSTPCLHRRSRKSHPSIKDEFQKMGLSSDVLHRGAGDVEEVKAGRSDKAVQAGSGAEEENEPLLVWLRSTRDSLTFPSYNTGKDVLHDLEALRSAFSRPAALRPLAMWIAFLFTLFATVAFFTLFCAFRVDSTVYRPYTWTPYLPEPFEILKLKRQLAVY